MSLHRAIVDQRCNLRAIRISLTYGIASLRQLPLHQAFSYLCSASPTQVTLT
jgi:hypothetical protein